MKQARLPTIVQQLEGMVGRRLQRGNTAPTAYNIRMFLVPHPDIGNDDDALTMHDMRLNSVHELYLARLRAIGTLYDANDPFVHTVRDDAYVCAPGILHARTTLGIPNSPAQYFRRCRIRRGGVMWCVALGRLLIEPMHLEEKGSRWRWSTVPNVLTKRR